MVKRVNDTLAGVPMSVVGGLCLAVSLILKLTGVTVLFDPAWATVFICGIPLLYLSCRRIIHNPGMKKISSALLISIAMVAAVSIGDIFAAGEVAFIMAVGAILEERTTERARRGLRALIEVVPQQGRRITGGQEVLISVTEIQPGDVLRILPGEKIPVDGEILTGNTSIDQAVLTGESLPVDKGVGELVFCGTVNQFGTVDIRATRVGAESSLQKLIEMVKEAEQNKAPMERIADQCATWLVPAALLIAIVTGVVTSELVRAVTVLVVFCPCALVLATPTAVMAAIGQATKYGVIIKSGEVLERMGKVDCIAFDKTGTLTYGKPEVTDVISLIQELDEIQVLKLTAAVEAMSEHPLARAITAFAKRRQVEIEVVSDFVMVPGKGVRAKTKGGKLLCGNARWLAENEISFSDEVSRILERLRAQGKAVILLARDDQVIGVVALSDVLRENAGAMVRELEQENTKLVLLTGDHQQTAEYFAQQVNLTAVYSELLPEHKAEAIRKLQAQGRHVCMIGDGVNDAPALKTADVGVVIGITGSDMAVEAADITLMGDDISKIPYLKRLSVAAVRTIKLSIGFSLVINLIAITLSVLGILTPTTGALVHNAGSVFVVLIAALLYDRDFFMK